MLVDITTEGAVRTVTMNRPEKLNAMSDEMLVELQDAFTAAPADEERVTILRGAGRSFCAGRDIGGAMNVSVEPVFSRGGDLSAARDCGRTGSRHRRRPARIALHCDFVVASTNARFGMSARADRSRAPPGSWRRSCSMSRGRSVRARYSCSETRCPPRNCTNWA